MHPKLRVGAILDGALEIIRIQPENYRLAVQEARANLAAAKAQLRELEINGENAERLLAIERRSLELTRQDLERQEGLVARGVASQSTPWALATPRHGRRARRDMGRDRPRSPCLRSRG